MSLQGLIHFPGVVQALGGGFTLSHGISPSVATLVMAPQVQPVAQGGTLQLTFGGVRLAFPGCRVNAASVHRGQGTTMTLQILDRRWKWRFGEINGHYNMRRADGSVIPATRKTPQELAGLLLQAMGETGFSAAELPNHSWPRVEWAAANPAQELAALCDALGCRVVLQLDNRVVIRRIGQGRLLPTGGDQMSASAGIDPPERPDSIKIVGGATRFQSKFRLQAVGLDRDGAIRPIDELQYVPPGGWQHENPAEFTSIEAEADRRLALRSVFRWYRIWRQADGSMQIPGYDGVVSFLWQLLPVSAALVETYLDADGQRRPQSAFIEGEYWPGGLDLQNTSASDRYDGAFRLDGPEGIVEFPRPVIKLGPENTTQPADLWLWCTHAVKHVQSREPARFTLERPMPGPRFGTGPRIVHRGDLAATVRAVYTNQNNLTGVVGNHQQIGDEARRQLDAIQVEYQAAATDEIQYAGLVPINPDGAVQQVSWTVGREGATTRAGRNTEFALTVPGYRQRRRRELVERAVG